jgi:cytochrome c oxidase cbb3-type subunit 4
MDINLLRSLITVCAMVAFAGIVWWAYGPARKRRFERDALMPFEEAEQPIAATRTARGEIIPSPLPPLPRGEGKRTAAAPREYP